MSEGTPEPSAQGQIPATEAAGLTSAAPARASSIFWDNVKEKIATRGAEVGERVVDYYANKEVNERADRALAAVAALQDLEGKIKKIKPDSVQYDLQGKEILSSYSKQTLEERKKLVEQAEKIEAALTDVFAEPPNFDKLKKLKLKPGEKDDEQAA